MGEGGTVGGLVGSDVGGLGVGVLGAGGDAVAPVVAPGTTGVAVTVATGWSVAAFTDKVADTVGVGLATGGLGTVGAGAGVDVAPSQARPIEAPTNNTNANHDISLKTRISRPNNM